MYRPAIRNDADQIRAASNVPEFIPVREGDRFSAIGYRTDEAGNTWVFLDYANRGGLEATAARLHVDGKTIKIALRANLPALEPLPESQPGDVPVQDSIEWFESRKIPEPEELKPAFIAVNIPFQPDKIVFVDRL